jgi:ferredoxin-thioredoxin reductase catalytic chain
MKLRRYLMTEISKEDIQKLYELKKTEAEKSGYKLNPDMDFTLKLVEGLLINGSRYGYRTCPCRLAVGKIEKDRDIVCPCFYRKADIEEYGFCYCALYISENILNNKIKIHSIPERRYAQNKS